MKENKLDKWDYICASASGSLTALLDIFFIEDISLSDAHAWGKKKTDEFVLSTAQSEGYKGKDLAGAIKHLEDKFPIYADDATNDFGGGNFHHLRDFSHHPTLTGLKYSIQTQFTGKAYGTDTAGRFIEVKIDGWEQHSFFQSVRAGTFDWIMHMISDMAGSSGSVQMGKEGTGIPGPLLSFLKELSAKPAIEKLVKDDKNGNDVFSVVCQKLFYGTLLGEHDENGNIIKGKEIKFDFRTELGLPNEILGKKQYLPVLINLAIISVLFFVRGILEEIQSKDITSITEINKVDIGNIFDWKNPRLRHMITLSQAFFSLIDISEAGIKSAINNRNDRSGFIRDFIQGINYCGLGALTISLIGEAGIKMYETYKHYTALVNEKFPLLIDNNPESKEIRDAARKTVNAVLSVGKLGTPVGFVFAAVGVYQEVYEAVKERNLARDARIQAEEYCRKNIAVLEAERDMMEQIVAEYIEKKLDAFSTAFNTMDGAVVSNDANEFIRGNRILQNELGRKSFENTDEFDAIMREDDIFML